MSDRPFVRCVNVYGGLLCSYVFTNELDEKQWRKHQLPKLEATYGRLSINAHALPGLTVGSPCKVIGEANETFVIKDIIKFNEHRYGFLLDNGLVEEVAKCR